MISLNKNMVTHGLFSAFLKPFLPQFTAETSRQIVGSIFHGDGLVPLYRYAIGCHCLVSTEEVRRVLRDSDNLPLEVITRGTSIELLHVILALNSMIAGRTD